MANSPNINSVKEVISTFCQTSVKELCAIGIQQRLPGSNKSVSIAKS